MKHLISVKYRGNVVSLYLFEGKVITQKVFDQTKNGQEVKNEVQ